MSGWTGVGGVGNSLGQALEMGRRSSIDFLTRLRTGSGGTYFFRNRKAGGEAAKDEASSSSPAQNRRPIPKNHSAPLMQSLIECPEFQVTVIEERSLIVERESLPQRVRGTRSEFVEIKTRESLEDDEKVWQRHGNDHLGLVLSALYAKLLVVCGTGFSLAEVISTYIPVAFYDGFYLYLYFVSILFMTAILGFSIKEKTYRHARNFAQGMSFRRNNTLRAPASPPKTEVAVSTRQTSSGYSTSSSESSSSSSPRIEMMIMAPAEARQRIRAKNLAVSKDIVRRKGAHFGSFYLRIGAVAFGVGTLIYSGIEFAQYFELKSDAKCQNYMVALTPVVRMVFTFMQMYFIFLNSKMAVSDVSWPNLLGLMHLIATNLCIWLNVLVQETKHEILTFYNPDNNTFSFLNVKAHKAYLNLRDDSIASEYDEGNGNGFLADGMEHHRVSRGLKGPHTILDCGRTDIIGSIVSNAAPYLFPCTIEFSLICAAICFVMWKHLAKRMTAQAHRAQTQTSTTYPFLTRSPHHYSVDCSRANKGLFLGIFFLVLTIMSIIINIVLDTREEYKEIANLEVNITEIFLYTCASIAVIIGMCQVRVLRYAKQRNLELDNILLIVAQTGSLIFNVFTIISGHFKGEKIVLLLALSKVVQLLLQTLFILDASNRAAATVEQAKRKPGREVVTFLLVTNLCMWMMNAVEKSRGESHPAQLQFYGVWGWTIITHISMPLAIFYRFHSTVCLCEIWKRAFKLKRR